MSTTTRQLNDKHRLAERGAQKALIAERELLRGRHKELIRQIADLDLRVDEADERHRDATAPLHAELSKVEAAIERCLVQRLPIPAAAAQRRRKLFDLLAEHNTTLAAELEGIKKLKSRLNNERQQYAEVSADIERLRNQLGSPPLANPDWHRELRAAQRDVAWAQRRVGDAARDHSRLEDAYRALPTDDGRDPEAVRFVEAAGWDVEEALSELRHAQELEASAHERVRTLKRKLRDE